MDREWQRKGFFSGRWSKQNDRPHLSLSFFQDPIHQGSDSIINYIFDEKSFCHGPDKLGAGTVNPAINDQVGNGHFDRYTQDIVMHRCGSAPLFPVGLDVGHGVAPTPGRSGTKTWPKQEWRLLPGGKSGGNFNLRLTICMYYSAR